MVAIPFVPPLEQPRYGESVRVSNLVRRVVAENPGKYSYTGTGTYILGDRDVVVIDPGPALDSHRDALTAALDGCTVKAILITHCHADHSPLAAWLREQTGAPTIAQGPHGDIGEPDEDDIELPPEVQAKLEEEARAKAAERGVEAGMEESVDTAFVPDVVIADGDLAYQDDALTITGLHTPGHTSNHMCFALAQERALFTGDHVMGWSTTVVAPPDGNMTQYVESLRRVIDREDSVLWPTHGNPVTDPRPYVEALLAHRLEREAQVVQQLRVGHTRIRDIVSALYADVRPELHKPAARSVLAHLVKLIDEGTVVTADGSPARLRSDFRLV